jgi:catechol 2,3-dioxygenase-like lactoylglutathione lyase family enzyme
MAGGTDGMVSVRYMVDDVQAAIDRMHFIVDDLAAEVARLRTAGVRFRNDVVTGPGGRQIVLEDPAGNPVELFQPARG